MTTKDYNILHEDMVVKISGIDYHGHLNTQCHMFSLEVTHNIQD